MKLKIDFVQPPRFTNVAIAMAVTAPLLLVALCLWLTFEVAAFYSDIPVLENRIKTLELRRGEVAKVALPSVQELSALRTRVQELSRIAGIRSWSTSVLLAWLEAELPSNARLIAFSHKPLVSEVVLITEGRDAATLSEFLAKLEREAAFKDVLLSKQSAQEDGAMQFEIKFKL